MCVLQTLLTAQNPSTVKLSFKVLNHLLKIQQRQEVCQLLQHVSLLNFTCNMNTYILFSLISYNDPHIDYEIITLVLRLLGLLKTPARFPSPVSTLQHLQHCQNQLSLPSIA